MPNTTIMPPQRVPVIDSRTGLMSREWYRFFMNLYILTGSGNNDTTISDLQIEPLISNDSLIPIELPIEPRIENYFQGNYPDQIATIIYDYSEKLKEIRSNLETLPIYELGDLVRKNNIGNVRIVGMFSVAPGSSVTPLNNGDISFQLTSDTSLTFKAKGSDGTVRSGSITLS